MAKIKYAPGETPLVNEHQSFTFQPNNYGQSMFPSAKDKYLRSPLQSQRQQNLMRAVREWRNMSPTIKSNWDNFATSYPQASRRNPAVFLTGYQLFIKRHHYLFLNNGIDANFMESPKLESLPAPSITFTIEQNASCIDVTELYISNFGIIPQVGDYILCKAYFMSRDSAQFFEPVEKTLQILESYVDGLFLSVSFVSAVPAISISIYLSKIVHQSKNYIGTKMKYMGCFSPKTFLELTDTPSDYTGESEKVVSVKTDESGLEFSIPGGGGLTCETLVNCDIIQQILTQLESLSTLVSQGLDTSVPPIKHGLFYNGWAIIDPKHLAPADWRVPSHIDYILTAIFLGGTAIAGGPMKETGFEWWDSPNLGATNLSCFNGRGSGVRSAAGGFSAFGLLLRLWTSTLNGVDMLYCYQMRNDVASFLNVGATYFTEGEPTRLCRDAGTMLDGEKGTLVGNDGKVYRTICIDALEFTADNIAETKFRDGSPIPEFATALEWMAASTSGMCAPGNDWTNV